MDLVKMVGLTAAVVTAPHLLLADDTPATASRRPNILWLIAEDLGPDLACYGNGLVKTPNLDRLASEGTLYTRAYTTGSLSSPSRSAFMTGMYQTTLGAHNHRSHQNSYKFPMGDLYLPEGVKILTDWMREAGYFTCNAKKFPTNAVAGTGKNDWNFTYRGLPFDSDNWEDLKTHQPFYAQVNFKETHTPYRPSKHPIDTASIVLPPYIPDHPLMRKNKAEYFGDIQNLDEKIGAVLKQLEDDGLAQNTVVIFIGDNGREEIPRGKGSNYEGGYHVPLIVRFPDHRNAGRVSSELVSMIDLAPTTLALAGIAIPKKMQGQPFLGRSAKSRECVFAATDRVEARLDRSRSVITKRYHYMRTWMPELPYSYYDNDILNKSKSSPYIPSTEPHTDALSQMYAEHKLNKLWLGTREVSAQEILLSPQRPPEELYDLETDPYEMKNLADSPAHRKVLAEMRSSLETWIRETGDQGEIPEDPAIVEGVVQYWKNWAKPFEK